MVYVLTIGKAISRPYSGMSPEWRCHTCICMEVVLQMVQNNRPSLRLHVLYVVYVSVVST